MGAAFGVDLSPLRLMVDSALPAYLGAQALARGTEIHLAPGAPAAGSPGGQHLLAREVGHVIQQNDRRVVPTTIVGGVALSTDAGLERAADAAAARFVRGEPAGVSQRAVLGAPPTDPVGQLHPPANVEEADRELAQVEQELFGQGHSVTWKNKYGPHVVKLEKTGCARAARAARHGEGEHHGRQRHRRRQGRSSSSTCG